MDLLGKKILLGVTGSIAAYKSADLCRLLVKSGAEVKVVMTHAATSIITPLTLSTLSQNQVYSDIHDGSQWHGHVELGLWADLMLIAPMTANTLAHFAHGICDSMLDAVYLSAKCPVMFAPAMDLDMWNHNTTQQNVSTLIQNGNILLPVGVGFLASGLNGPGRMAEPSEINQAVLQFFKENQDLQGKKVLVTAGPTYENIDPVRFIGNHSSGKMGIALAALCKQRGADVNLVIGPTTQDLSMFLSHEVHKVRSAAQMAEICGDLFPLSDIAILAAAVADYTPLTVADQKIKKNDGHLVIELKKTVDIAATLGQEKKLNQMIVGFALETESEVDHAKSKLKRKNFDFIVLNSLNDPQAGFGFDTNKVTLIDENGIFNASDLVSKAEIANIIIDEIVKRLK